MQSSSIVSYSFRLKPDQDLKVELQKFAKENGLKAAAIVSGVGSLKTLKLRLANGKDVRVFEGCHEIVSMAGTLWETGMHVHLSASDTDGKTIGGHLVEGNFIFTTCELVLIEQPGLEFTRQEDPTSGYLELVVRSRL
ncbi:MAG: PPC domain-containing DNA-binding protein [Pseudobdellovibrionaceae bacterium]